MKILIAEYVNHYKVIENTHKLIELNSVNSEITLFVNKDKPGTNLRELLFKDASSANWIIHKFHSTTFFIHLLVIGRNYDIINISTGPEGSHYSNLLNALFFYVCSVVYKDKIVLTIKNTRPFLKSTRGIKSFFLNLAISKIKVFTFETNTLKKIFHKETSIPLSSLCVSYDRYADLYNVTKAEKNKYEFQDIKYKIGLLGSIDTCRRDYFEIINSLKKVPDRKSVV